MPTTEEEHYEMIQLSRVRHPVMRALMPVLGPLAKRLFHIDRVNEVERAVFERATRETFYQTTLEVLGCQFEVDAGDLERIPESGPVAVVSNHPLGGLDGIVLGEILRRRRPDTLLMANYLLKRVRMAADHMIFVDPFARDNPAAANVSPLRQSLKHLKNGGLLGIFPGNQVSHYRKETGLVEDPPWVAHIAALIRRSGATVVPVRIIARNSWLFERAGLVHPLLRTLMLPREFMRRGLSPEPIRVVIGEPVPAPRMARFSSDEEAVAFLQLASRSLAMRPPPKKAVAVSGMARKPLAEAVESAVLRAEVEALKPRGLLLEQGEMEVLVGDFESMPAVMREIGRGRELSFREAGGGTGEEVDLAEADSYYKHLFVWNRERGEVVGAYRLGLTDEILPKRGAAGLVSSGLFEFSPSFLRRIGCALELGRSYVLPEYQRSYSSLLLLWAGILRFIARHPRYRVIVGAVGISQGDEYCAGSRRLIVDYLRGRHGRPELAGEVTPREPFQGMGWPADFAAAADGLGSLDDVSMLVSGIEPDGKGVPILIKHYIRMKAGLVDFGVWKDHSNAVVAFLMCDLADADPKFLRRYMGAEGYESFLAYHKLQTSPENCGAC
jgi:putative hemolysin